MSLEVARPNLLSCVIERFACSLAYDEVEWLPELVHQGLFSVCLCQHGIGRSHKAANFLSEFGKPSVCFDGGLEDFSELEPKEQITIAQKFAVVPKVFAILTPEEIRDFKASLKLIAAFKGNDFVIKDSLPPLLEYISL